MPQIPRYILTLHELLAHTPHEHVERNSLDYAKSKLEELSRSEPWGGAGLCGTDGGGGSGSVPSFVSLPSAAPPACFSGALEQLGCVSLELISLLQDNAR